MNRKKLPAHSQTASGYVGVTVYASSPKHSLPFQLTARLNSGSSLLSKPGNSNADSGSPVIVTQATLFTFQFVPIC